jgi:DNA adenine methylase
MKKNIATIKPCLRWAGGKSWLVKYLGDLLPRSGYLNYHEPFLGGASVFLHLKPQATSYLSDLNPELIDTYIALRDQPREVINILASYRNTEAFYYEIRSYEPINEAEKAARFIYLNHTSFNGIYRVNLRGEYNVPYGYRKKDFLEKDSLLSVSRALQGAVLQIGDFDIIRENIHENDLVFLDPPYTVSHNDNGFIKYNQTIFSLDDQVRLSALVRFINDSGAYYILTNAAHTAIEEIFDNGDQRMELRRASTIGGINAHRGQTSEYLFTNIM